MSHNFIAKRHLSVRRTPMGDVNEKAKKYSDIIDLSLGDPDITTHDDVIDAAMGDAKGGYTHYTDFLGDEALRKAIQEDYKTSYNYQTPLDEIMITVGGCHGMYLALEAIIDDGDEVIIHAPYFTPYLQQIQLVRGNPVIVDTYEKDGFQIDIDDLKKKITNKTKAIILNYPNNPTGATFKKEVIEGIAQVAIENDLIVISDDIYTSLCYEGEFMPIAAFPGMKDRTIIVGSFSKDYVMTGWRIGYVLAQKSIINCMRDINEGVCFTAPSVSQRAALKAITMKEKIQKGIKETFKERVFYAYERIKNLPKVSVKKPESTFYLFMNIKETGLDSVAFSEVVLEKAHVLVLPGIAFGDSGEGYVRIACTVGVEALKEAFDRMEQLDILKT